MKLMEQIFPNLLQNSSKVKKSTNLPDSPPTPSPAPSQPPTPSPKLLSSYHTAPLSPHPLESEDVCCEGCDEIGHLLEKCGHNYCYNPFLDTYTPILYGEKAKPCYPGWAPVVFLESEKTGKPSA